MNVPPRNVWKILGICVLHVTFTCYSKCVFRNVILRAGDTTYNLRHRNDRCNRYKALMNVNTLDEIGSACTTLKINSTLSISDMFPNTLKFNTACFRLFYFKRDSVIVAVDIGSLFTML